jgi:prefoldin subunit 5
LVEVGAGYFVEKGSEKAKEYCDRKIKMLTDNGSKVAEIV